jgi:hypothetical protein
VAAGVAKVAAETAETNAETAQAASETAKTASEAAKVAAETAETNASTSASTATTQAGIATTKAGEAAASATASANSATASEAAKDAALAALDNFDDRYLGAKASDPTVDNDGNPLISGSLYFNTTDDVMKVYEGSQWVAAYASLSGALLVANNLSDLASASAGRINLGLGTAATTASTDYATAAQGALAASATQPGDLATVATSGAYSDLSGTPSPFDPSTLATVATSGAYSDLSGKPTLGTAASTASTDYATAAQGALAASATQPGDLGTAATAAATDFVAVTGDSMTGNLDITGTLTSDGLTVEGNSSVSKNMTNGSSAAFTDPHLALKATNSVDTTGFVGMSFATSDNTNYGFSLGAVRSSGGVGDLVFRNHYNSAQGTKKLTIATNGDISFFEDTGTTPKFFWDSSAEALGIGTTSTGGETFVVEKSSGTPTIRINAPSGSQAQLKLQADGTVTDTQMIHANTDASLGFSRWNGAAYQEHMRITSSGVVGIGVSDPSTWSLGKALHIGVKENNLWGEADYAFHMNQNAYYNGGWKYSHTDEATQYTQADGQHIWSYAGSGSANAALSWSEAARLDASGNFLVGKSSASSTTAGFQASQDGQTAINRSGTALQVGRLSSDGTIAEFRKNGTAVGKISVADSDNVGFLSTVSNHGGIICGTASIVPALSGTYSNGATDIGTGTSKWRDLYLSGTANAANFNTTSDATLKTNVETLSGSLDAVTSLRGVSFDWLENGGSEIGVIAQEVEAVLPDVVSTNDEGIKSVKYGNMVAVLIEAIKEQQLRIEALEAKLGE